MNKYHLIFALGLLLLLVPLSGQCSGTDWSEQRAEQRFRDFLLRANRGEMDRAFEFISPANRRKIGEPREALKRTFKEAPPLDEMLVVSDVDSPYDIKDIELEGQISKRPDEGQTRTLELTYHYGASKEATMVWRKSDWYVKLF